MNYTERFLAFIPFILKWETVYDRKGNVVTEHDPNDPGGATRFGIDKAAHPQVDVEHLTKDGAMAIYASEWGSEGIEDLPPKLGEVYFNCCVNCGVGRANKIMVSVKPPGGPGEFLDGQEDFYRRLVAGRPRAREYLKGWLNRTEDLRRRVLEG